MTDANVQDLEDTAAAYDKLLVPAILREWTQPVAEAAEIGPGQRVLDVACGTGILTRAAAARVGSRGSVVGLDINPAMLAVAARIPSAIEWRQGEAESLPFEDRSFDAAISQFGLMFFRDREAALREMARVVVAGGRVGVAVFDRLDNIPAYRTMAGVFEEVVGKETADALRSPFALGDPQQLAALFAAAGMPAAKITTRKGTGRFASVRDMVLADVEGWFPFARIELNEAAIEAVIAQARAALQPFLTAGGAVEFHVSAHIAAMRKA
jgi:ubiquinone/menaquinone biosynthesis C-methylase UbiE